MKEIATNNQMILFVEVPEDAIFFKIEYDGLIAYNDLDSEMPDFINIHFGNYQILGKSTELNGDNIVECKIIGRKIEYRNYRNGKFNLGNPLASYLSLLEANGIVDRNPYNKPNEADILEEHENWIYARAKYKSLLEQWQKAQSKVKTYLVLKRI